MASSPSNPARPTCATCGAPVAAGTGGGQCPHCLLNLAFGLAEPDAEVDGLLDATQVRGFGDYELIEEIARGGMGVVYRARQLSLGREVAVKMILAGELATAESVQRFRKEAEAAARLDHPNIVPVYEIGEHEMQHYFSMRLVLGRRNIAAWAKELAPSASVRASRVAAMLAKVAKAMSFAHDRGVLHRDLKPTNILVDEKGEPQVTDFGLAKLVNEQDNALTHSVVMLGSPSYMAPEQANGKHDAITTATDVYGLGAVLYELLAGRPPFMASSPLATARLVVEQLPERLRETPIDLETICLKCLAKEPAQRYSSAHEVAEELERFARGEPIHARPLSLPQTLWRWSRRYPKIAALLIALLLAFLLGFAGVTWQWRRAELARAEQTKAADHLRWAAIVRQAETDEAPVALAQLAAMLRADPKNWQAAMLAMSVIDQRAFPLLAGPPVTPKMQLVTPPCLAPDGTWFAAAGHDQAIHIWDVATGLEHPSVVLDSEATALAVSAGPLALAVAATDGRIVVRATLGSPSTPLPRTSSSRIDALRFSADGAQLVAHSKDGIEVWKSADPSQPPRSFAVNGLAGFDLSADGTRLLAWNSKQAIVWDTVSEKVMLEISPRKGFRHATMAPNGKRIALIDGGYAAACWEVDSGTQRSLIESPLDEWRFVAANPDGTRITLIGSANDCVVYDTASGLPVSPPMRHFYKPYTLVASADGTRTATFGADGRACLWDATSGQSISSAVWLNTNLPAATSLSRDGRIILIHPAKVGDSTTPISVWKQTRTRPPRRQHIDGERDFNSGQLSPDERLGCLGLYPSHRAYVYELATGRVLLDAETKGDVYVHLFSPDQRKYYVLTANGWHYGWDLTTGAELWPPRQEPGYIRPGAISPDGSRIIAGHNDGHIRIYDTANGALVQTLDHPGEVKTLRFAPDGSGRFVSGSTDGLAHLWDVTTGKRLQTYAGHGGAILSSAWSPDSRFIATASFDQTARVWDAVTGQEIGQPMWHMSWLSHLEFSPDGQLLATACRDTTVRLWHPLTGEPASSPLPQDDTPETVRFIRDGRCFLVRDHRGFRFWSTDKAEAVTGHYREPASGGLGMDSESWRDLITTDGTHVFLGYSINEGAFWTIPQPRETVPAWFPTFLESLALMRSEGGSVRISPAEKLQSLKARVPTSQPKDTYAEWAAHVLGE